jgi:predicted RNA-binding Zn-ribbon protein involved in translation (DUF1610 family)
MQLKIPIIKVCDECKSEFHKSSSSMENLCPECANLLYGYKNCEHQFENNRCNKCYWNGNSSDFLNKTK